ncbi:hypothetical protein RSOCI_03810 [Rhabdochlamydiaceae symbiont of Dictyostelium giganteum]
MLDSTSATTNTSGQITRQPFAPIADRLTQKVNAVCKLWEESSDSIGTQKGLEDLYLEGLKLVTAEVQLRPLTGTILTQIVTSINDKVTWKNFESRYDVHASLSKTYRIFLELVWYRSFFTNDTVSKSTKQDLFDKAVVNLECIPQAYPSIRFEYECSRQAIKVLQISQSLLSRYGSTVVSIAANTVTTVASVVGNTATTVASFVANTEISSFIDTTVAIREFIEKMKMDLSSKWYIEVHELRWMATAIRTANDFNQVINPIRARFQENGKEYTLGLAATYMDLIRNPDVEDAVKFEAVEGFLTLAKLKDSSLRASLIQKMGKTLSREKLLEYGKECDKYHATRLLIKEYIHNVRLYFNSLGTIVDEHLNADNTPYMENDAVIRQKKVAPDALAELIVKYESLEAYINQTEQFIQDTRDVLTDAEQEERDREVELAREELKEAQIEEAELNKEVEEMKAQLVEEILAQLDQDEQDEWEKIKSSL